MKLVYYWLPWAYSHQACSDIASRLNLPVSSMEWYSSAHELRQQIDDSTLAVLPIENSTAGTVHLHQYKFLHYEYKILAEYYMDIHHCLLATHTDTSKISKVISHPQALDQCYQYLVNNGYAPHAFSDTAASAEQISRKWLLDTASIASEKAAEIYNLHIIEKNIQDKSNNCTRFFLVGNQAAINTRGEEIHKGQQEITKNNKSIILLDVRDRPWVLYDCLWVLIKHGLNMTKLESIPSRDDPFVYQFRIEIDQTSNTDPFTWAMHDLQEYTKDIQILWSL